MPRDVRELLALVAAGLVLGLAHLAFRPDMSWVPAPRVEETVCGELEPALPAEAPAASFAPAEPMSSPGPEDVR